MNDLIRNEMREIFGVNSPGYLAFLCKVNVQLCNADADNRGFADVIWTHMVLLLGERQIPRIVIF